jgi:hypothetical protein
MFSAPFGVEPVIAAATDNGDRQRFPVTDNGFT